MLKVEGISQALRPIGVQVVEKQQNRRRGTTACVASRIHHLMFR